MKRNLVVLGFIVFVSGGTINPVLAQEAEVVRVDDISLVATFLDGYEYKVDIRQLGRSRCFFVDIGNDRRGSQYVVHLDDGAPANPLHMLDGKTQIAVFDHSGDLSVEIMGALKGKKFNGIFTVDSLFTDPRGGSFSGETAKPAGGPIPEGWRERAAPSLRMSNHTWYGVHHEAGQQPKSIRRYSKEHLDEIESHIERLEEWLEKKRKEEEKRRQDEERREEEEEEGPLGECVPPFDAW